MDEDGCDDDDDGCDDVDVDGEGNVVDKVDDVDDISGVDVDVDDADDCDMFICDNNECGGKSGGNSDGGNNLVGGNEWCCCVDDINIGAGIDGDNNCEWDGWVPDINECDAIDGNIKSESVDFIVELLCWWWPDKFKGLTISFVLLWSIKWRRKNKSGKYCDVDVCVKCGFNGSFGWSSSKL